MTGLHPAAAGMYHALHNTMARPGRGPLQGCLTVGNTPMGESEIARDLGFSRMREFRVHFDELIRRTLIDVHEHLGLLFFRVTGFVEEQRRMQKRAQRDQLEWVLGSSAVEELQGVTTETGRHCLPAAHTPRTETPGSSPVEESQGVTTESGRQAGPSPLPSFEGGEVQARGLEGVLGSSAVEEFQGVTTETGRHCLPAAHTPRTETPGSRPVEESQGVTTESGRPLARTRAIDIDRDRNINPIPIRAREAASDESTHHVAEAPSGAPAVDHPPLPVSPPIIGNGIGTGPRIHPSVPPSEVFREQTQAAPGPIGNAIGNGRVEVPPSGPPPAGAPEGASATWWEREWGPVERQKVVKLIVDRASDDGATALWRKVVAALAPSLTGRAIIAASVREMQAEMQDPHAEKIKRPGAWLQDKMRKAAAEAGIAWPAKRSGKPDLKVYERK